MRDAVVCDVRQGAKVGGLVTRGVKTFVLHVAGYYTDVKSKNRCNITPREIEPTTFAPRYTLYTLSGMKN